MSCKTVLCDQCFSNLVRQEHICKDYDDINELHIIQTFQIKEESWKLYLGWHTSEQNYWNVFKNTV